MKPARSYWQDSHLRKFLYVYMANVRTVDLSPPYNDTKKARKFLLLLLKKKQKKHNNFKENKVEMCDLKKNTRKRKMYCQTPQSYLP